MHPADEFFRLRQEIRALSDRADALRARFLSGDVALESTDCRVTIRQTARRVLVQSRLPPEILEDPFFWEERVSPVVKVRKVAPDPPGDEGFDLLERW